MITGHLPELVLILVAALIFFGPKRLPEIGEAMGKSIRSFKSGISHLDEPAHVEIAHVEAAHETEVPLREPIPVDRKAS